MTDFALSWNADAGTADLSIAGGVLSADDGLRTAILISLFTDARASSHDSLPEAGADRRGWWGDAVPDKAGDVIGSKLWLLSREKIVPAVVARARDYVREALAWLIVDRVASSIDVIVEIIRPATLAIGIVIERPTGPDRQRFDFVWEASS